MVSSQYETRSVRDGGTARSEVDLVTGDQIPANGSSKTSVFVEVTDRDKPPGTEGGAGRTIAEEENSADQVRDDGLASNRRDNAVATSESPIADVVAAAAKLAHDHVAAECHRDHTVKRSVSHVDAGFACALVRKRPAARERDHGSKEIAVREPEPQGHPRSG